MMPEATSGDYRARNSVITPGRFQSPLRISPKLPSLCLIGLFEFTRIFSGPRNADETFQRLIDYALCGLPFVYAYIDDLLVASQNAEKHKEHLALVLNRLGKYDVVINPQSVFFGVPPLEFLGHHVDSEGLLTLPSEVETIRDFPTPTSNPQLQRFLSMVNFYHRFLPNCANLMLPLTSMMSGRKGPPELIGYALNVFKRIKVSLADAALLRHPAPKTPLSLMSHTSTVAVGAILQQHLTDSTRRLAFFPRTLSPAQTRDSTFGRALIPIYLTVEHFEYFLEGRDFTIFADHKPLAFAVRAHPDRNNPRGVAHLVGIPQLTTKIRQNDETKIEVAVMLSRHFICCSA
ncbi:hypothetical protein SprV_0501892200 [Sparganum proliferum]